MCFAEKEPTPRPIIEFAPGFPRCGDRFARSLPLDERVSLASTARDHIELFVYARTASHAEAFVRRTENELSNDAWFRHGALSHACCR